MWHHQSKWNSGQCKKGNDGMPQQNPSWDSPGHGNQKDDLQRVIDCNYTSRTRTLIILFPGQILECFLWMTLRTCAQQTKDSRQRATSWTLSSQHPLCKNVPRRSQICSWRIAETAQHCSECNATWHNKLVLRTQGLICNLLSLFPLAFCVTCNFCQLANFLCSFVLSLGINAVPVNMSFSFFESIWGEKKSKLFLVF